MFVGLILLLILDIFELCFGSEYTRIDLRAFEIQRFYLGHALRTWVGFIYPPSHVNPPIPKHLHRYCIIILAGIIIKCFGAVQMYGPFGSGKITYMTRSSPSVGTYTPNLHNPSTYGKFSTESTVPAPACLFTIFRVCFQPCMTS